MAHLDLYILCPASRPIFQRTASTGPYSPNNILQLMSTIIFQPRFRSFTIGSLSRYGLARQFWKLANPFARDVGMDRGYFNISYLKAGRQLRIRLTSRLEPYLMSDASLLFQIYIGKESRFGDREIPFSCNFPCPSRVIDLLSLLVRSGVLVEVFMDPG
jgi:hypothetical protein